MEYQKFCQDLALMQFQDWFEGMPKMSLISCILCSLAWRGLCWKAPEMSSLFLSWIVCICCSMLSLWMNLTISQSLNWNNKSFPFTQYIEFIYFQSNGTDKVSLPYMYYYSMQRVTANSAAWLKGLLFYQLVLDQSFARIRNHNRSQQFFFKYSKTPI